jgi:hypothetical protein
MIINFLTFFKIKTGKNFLIKINNTCKNNKIQRKKVMIRAFFIKSKKSYHNNYYKNHIHESL